MHGSWSRCTAVELLRVMMEVDDGSLMAREAPPDQTDVECQDDMRQYMHDCKHLLAPCINVMHWPGNEPGRLGPRVLDPDDPADSAVITHVQQAVWARSGTQSRRRDDRRRANAEPDALASAPVLALAPPATQPEQPTAVAAASSSPLAQTEPLLPSAAPSFIDDGDGAAAAGKRPAGGGGVAVAAQEAADADGDVPMVAATVAAWTFRRLSRTACSLPQTGTTPRPSRRRRPRSSTAATPRRPPTSGRSCPRTTPTASASSSPRSCTTRSNPAGLSHATTLAAPTRPRPNRRSRAPCVQRAAGKAFLVLSFVLYHPQHVSPPDNNIRGGGGLGSGFPENPPTHP